jgi:hypothetical protein
MPAAKTDTAVWRAVGHYVVMVHSRESPGDAEWDRILGVFRNLPEIHRVRILVYTDGGAPAAHQRVKLSHVLSAFKPPVAVVTSSTLARTAGTAISWFIPTLRVFGPEAIERALDHLDASQAERMLLHRALVELRQELGV